ncbi:MAG TPA: group II intron reverse transcriptase/maturase [Pyrinomonadaceae bacterium]|nr:group II intron reverse transcriptase/maturase [Pyrinomonadaceae bacterium]
MMNGRRKSDRPVVATKPANKAGATVNDAGGLVAEQVERRGLAKGKPPRQNANRAQDREVVQSALGRIRQAAVKDRKAKFTSLMHHIYNLSTLREAYYGLKRDAAAGVDGETWRQYGENLESNLTDLTARLRRGAYRAKAVLRRYITKDDGRLRPLGVTALEDKLVQRATVTVLNGIYETDFLGFSYGYRPGKGQHNALDALYTGLLTRKVNWVLDGDLSSFFDGLDHEWLMKFIEHRVADQRVVRLIRKWLSAGVLEEGQWRCSEEGTPQGGSASPLLANIYLHYVFDLWVQHWRKTKARGDVIVVRWADDFVVGFEHQSDAARFHHELAERFAQFKLKLHPEKTRVIEFGRYAAERRKRRGQGKPETFNFLGFTHICGKQRSNGMFAVWRRTMSKRQRAKLKAVKTELRKRMHQRVAEVGKWLRSVVTGHNRYYGVPSNLPSLGAFRFQVGRYWYRTLRRRSQKSRLSWARMYRLLDCWLPRPTLHHPYPSRRLGVIT